MRSTVPSSDVDETPIFREVYGRLTDEQREQHRLIREEVERNLPELMRRTGEAKAELDALIAAAKLLKREREARGISLAEVARRSELPEARLAEFENQPFPNPMLLDLTRIASALGVRLTIGVSDEAA